MKRGSRKNSYENNVYAMLKRRGLSQKYEHPGIYSISIDDQLVYIGKSKNMLRRVAQHYVGIQTGRERKYRILAEAQRLGYSVKFDVLYYANEKSLPLLEDELGTVEGDLIRKNLPVLNKQIPKADNWRCYDINPCAQTITLPEVLQAKQDKALPSFFK